MKILLEKTVSYQHVYECLCALEHSQYQQDQKPQDLIEEQNHQRGSWFEEEKAAKNTRWLMHN